MGLFGQARDLYKLQKQAKQVKQELKNLHIEAEVNGILVVMSAEQEVQEIKIPESLLAPEKAQELQRSLKEVLNKAIKKAQEVAAERMRDLMGQMGMDLPGAGAA